MSDALDPFSYYVPAASMAAYKTQQASGVVSAGIVFARRAGYPYVVAPLPGSPAQKAGVQPGDLIDSVDGKTLRNAPFWQVQAALDGPEGSSCEIGLFRGGDEKKLTISLQRTKFEPPVPTTKWERDVAILKTMGASARSDGRGPSTSMAHASSPSWETSSACGAKRFNVADSLNR